MDARAVNLDFIRKKVKTQLIFFKVNLIVNSLSPNNFLEILKTFCAKGGRENQFFLPIF